MCDSRWALHSGREDTTRRTGTEAGGRGWGWVWCPGEERGRGRGLFLGAQSGTSQSVTRSRVAESGSHVAHSHTPHASEKRVPLRPPHCLGGAAAAKFTAKCRAIASPRLRGESGEQRVTRRRRVRPARRWARRLIRRPRPASSRPAGEQLCARGLPMVRVRVRIRITLTLTPTLTLILTLTPAGNPNPNQPATPTPT